jgi:predicted DNA-binding transcriptional regulator YafY
MSQSVFRRFFVRLHRLTAILLLLESRGQLKARELADALEASERTIHRDIATLCEAGIPIEAIAGPTGGFRQDMLYAKCFMDLLGWQPDKLKEVVLPLIGRA